MHNKPWEARVICHGCGHFECKDKNWCCKHDAPVPHEIKDDDV